MDQKFTCLVCGYPDMEDPVSGDNDFPTFAICPSCGTEFGLDDANKSYAELRAVWIRNGMSWWSKSRAEPEGWDPSEQLKLADLRSD